MRRKRFLSIWRRWTQDHNLCIWQNFACGVDLTFVPGILPCLGLDHDVGGWFFFDSHDCGPYPPPENHFYLAGYVNRVDGSHYDGFFEVADATATLSFTRFVQSVKTKNPGSMNGIHGVYQSFSGHAIQFDSHQNNSDRTGIESIDGNKVDDLDAWPHADGVLVGAWTDAVLTINNPGLPSDPPLPASVKIDFSDWNNPHLDVTP